jgi:hypothetical protein
LRIKGLQQEGRRFVSIISSWATQALDENQGLPKYATTDRRRKKGLMQIIIALKREVFPSMAT